MHTHALIACQSRRLQPERKTAVVGLARIDFFFLFLLLLSPIVHICFFCFFLVCSAEGEEAKGKIHI